MQLADVLANPNATQHLNIDSDHTRFSTMTLEHVGAATEEQLQAFISNFPTSVVRAKGIVQLADGTHRLIQKVGSTVTISETALPTSGLVIISVE
jgi:G3E family GTPase